MNNVQLLGRLTRDVDLRQTTSGIAFARFSIAVNRTYKNQQGEREADFINCVAYRQTAELIARYFQKGSQIAVDGRIQTGSYENQQGQRVYTTDVVVNNFYFTESRAASEQRSNYAQDSFGGNSYQTNNYNQGGFSSFNNDFNQSSSPFSGIDGGPIDITEDDLPF